MTPINSSMASSSQINHASTSTAPQNEPQTPPNSVGVALANTNNNLLWAPSRARTAPRRIAAGNPVICNLYTIFQALPGPTPPTQPTPPA